MAEEEDKNQNLHDECPTRTLNLNVPPLSTRRPFGDKMLPTTAATATDSANMVPFSWERIPGEPKDSHNLAQNHGIVVTPPPKLPPGQRQPKPTEEEANQCGGYDIIPSGSSCHEVEVDCVDGHSERFSDAIDIFSLAESTEEDCRGHTAEDRSRSSAFLPEPGNRINGGSCYSPNFMIERFLPDAQALAEESVTNKTTLPLSNSSAAAAAAFSKAVNIKRSYHHHHQQPPKLGCGLGSFLPWRMKPKPCGVKSPVCDTIIGPSNHKQNPR